LQVVAQSVLRKLFDDGHLLASVAEELKNDKEVVLAAVEHNGHALQHASVELKADKGVVLAAVEQTGLALKHASVELKNDKEVALAAVEQDGGALQNASVELKADKEVVLTAAAQSGEALKCSLIERGDLVSFVRSRRAAHGTFVAFLCAAHQSSSGAAQPAPTTLPALWVLDGLGEDAGRHVWQLIAGFAGAPCGKDWVTTRAAAWNGAI
jgi:hypothetical protein